MKLLAFRYKEKGWELDFTQFSEQILLVGQNASGKSKTIKSLAKVAAILSQLVSFSKTDSMDVVLVFQTATGGLFYQFVILDGNVVKERLSFTEFSDDDKPELVIIDRDEHICTLHGESINPPANKLVVNVRRDTQLYPYMEMLQSWAENVIGFSFNETDMYGDSRNGSWFYGYTQKLNDVVVDIEATSGAKEELLAKLADIGYNISDIRALDFDTEKKVLVKEVGLSRPIFDVTMSKGMFRAIYLVAYILYFKRNKKGQPAMLLVDDLCEGLDYDRSTKLGRLCFEMCEEIGFQLMASSNDSFLMDVVDLKYWNILRRVGNKVEVVNASGEPELFDHFEMTGLSNFDLFSSDFISRYQEKLNKK